MKKLENLLFVSAILLNTLFCAILSDYTLIGTCMNYLTIFTSYLFARMAIRWRLDNAFKISSIFIILLNGSITSIIGFKSDDTLTDNWALLSVVFLHLFTFTTLAIIKKVNKHA